MDADNSDKEWKKALGFPINYTPEGSEDDFDHNDVVFRRPRQTEILLADGGDGAEADLLGTTPPRELRRDKKKRKTIIDSVMLREGRRMLDDMGSDSPDRLRNRLSLKMDRTRARDWKQGVTHREKSDSLPSPNPLPAVPTLVESCNRFMSLTSRLKSPRGEGGDAGREPGADVPANRVSFHETFSMLINMGNAEKGCRRTISREEQVWQNELKDLIWLELQARIAGRTLAEQDAFLCSQRKIVPHIVQNIRNYRFVNPNPCCNGGRRLGVIEGSTEDVWPDSGTEQDDISSGCCLSLGCQQCSDAVGKAMREVGTLLDSFYNAHSLYPSSQAMTADHALIATQLFQNRIKAMCLWYNTAQHMRMKMMAVRRMTRSLRMKERRRAMRHLLSTDSAASRQSFESRQCQVRFNISQTPTDSNNSDSSGQSEASKETDSKKECQNNQSAEEDRTEKSDQEGNKTEEETKDEVDRGLDKAAEQSQPTTPEVVIDSRYGTADTVASTESGYTSAHEESAKETDDIYCLGSLDDLTELRLLNKCSLSVYRTYHHEILKTAGVRRCMRFMNKMRCNLLHKVYCTLKKPDQMDRGESIGEEEHPVEVFGDAKDDDERQERQDDAKLYELSRYGCWSEECVAMNLPSYRNHFLLLGTICLEAAHDYLELRLEDRPNEPSCLTIKQLIHELKEGLDIATDMRAAFARNISVALAGKCSNQAGSPPRQDLLLILRTFDNTVETVFKQYLSYLRTMSAVEWMSRSVLQTEWLFTARLARRLKCAALLAPPIFAEIACNQLDRLYNQFEKKFVEIDEMHNSTDNPDKQFVYAMCRAVQQIYASERDATLQSAQWARALAAKLAKRYKPQRANIAASLMRIRDLIVSQTKKILIHSREAAEELSQLHNLALAARIRELLLQIYRFGFEIHKELHRFVREPLPAPRGRLTSSPSKSGRGGVRYTRQFSDGGAGDDALERLIDINSFGETQVQSSIELLLSGETPQTEDEGVELRNSEWKASDEDRELATKVARAVVEFAKCWMQFVVERCDTGRGLRPRWASKGLEFLMLACDPCNTKHLTEAEFEDLKKMMDGCISHVIGSRPVTSRTTDGGTSQVDHGHRRRPRLHSPLPSREPRGAVSSPPSPPSPPSEPDPLLSFPGIDCQAHSSRVMEAVSEVERRRDEELRKGRAVGRVVEAAVSDYEPKLRQLKFKWQRGLKIGQGTFGKVYTVVNTESGQLLAMKELSVGAGDRRALHRAANELRVLEGVLHPHLVRYYGAELHREELLLFMELCVEGSLESLVGTWGALDEQTVRRYARQLVSAVAELHARAIAHRDIKSGNIFLTNEGHCLKLGDFGCAVKIRANTTAAGELIGHVGTQAYMAPEVFMKSTGHGRAADIWSLGCVVTEMASGKRPFSEYDSNVQIMFVVGMGGRPAVADTLSQEGRDFCLACLTHEPDARPRADQLYTHHFLKLKSDDTEDCKCEPAFLM